MLKRLLDLAIALPLTLLSAPVVAILLLIIWAYDRGNPLYIPHRVGRDGQPFPLFKLRSMVVAADHSGVDTTIKGDSRLLPFAGPLRRFKFDELPQLWNVLLGQMSLVGPRPNVEREVAKYSEEERRLLSVKPGLTDFASVVYSDLAERLAGQADANYAYETMIRPTKTRLGLFYVDHRTLGMDLVLIVATAVSICHRPAGMRIVRWLLERHGASPDLTAVVASRQV